MGIKPAYSMCLCACLFHALTTHQDGHIAGDHLCNVGPDCCWVTAAVGPLQRVVRGVDIARGLEACACSQGQVNLSVPASSGSVGLTSSLPFPPSPPTMFILVALLCIPVGQNFVVPVFVLAIC